MTAAEDLEAVLQDRGYMEDAIQADVATLGRCPPHLNESTFDIPLPDGTTSRSIITRPASTSAQGKKCPLIILFFGGGWTTGSPALMLSPARGYASLFGAIVVCPGYKLAPENRFPKPMHSAWEATAWLSHPQNLKEGPLKDDHVEFEPGLGIVVGGVSAGANIAAVIAGITAEDAASKGHSALTEGLSKIAHPITGVFLSIPLLVSEEILPAEYAPLWTSREDNGNALRLPTERVSVVERRLGPDHKSPWFSPLNLKPDTVKGHHAPRVYFQAGSLDSLRDDSVVYERFLRDRGIAEARIDIVEGVDHAGWASIALEACHSDTMKTVSLDGMAWLLGKDWDRTQELPY